MFKYNHELRAENISIDEWTVIPFPIGHSIGEVIFLADKHASGMVTFSNVPLSKSIVSISCELEEDAVILSLMFK